MFICYCYLKYKFRAIWHWSYGQRFSAAVWQSGIYCGPTSKLSFAGHHKLFIILHLKTISKTIKVSFSVARLEQKIAARHRQVDYSRRIRCLNGRQSHRNQETSVWSASAQLIGHLREGRRLSTQPYRQEQRVNTKLISVFESY